jgi:hypothetical protein
VELPLDRRLEADRERVGRRERDAVLLEEGDLVDPDLDLVDVELVRVQE